MRETEETDLRCQEKTLWVEPACADCPGLLVPDAAGALRLEARDCAPELAFASCALGHLLGSASHDFPATCATTGRPAQVFATQGGTHRRQWGGFFLHFDWSKNWMDKK